MNHIEMMRLAEQVAKRSVCKRAQVGAAITMNGYGDIYVGWNHRVVSNHGWNDFKGCCEGEDGRTLPDVMHAEAMAINDLWQSEYGAGAWLYVTRQPCIACAELIVGTGIERVYYRDGDDKTDGLEFLQANGVQVNSGWILGQVQESWAERNGVVG